MSAGAIRVLVVDDSPICVEALRSVIDSDPRMRVVGVAHDGLRAIELATQLRPTVITMDVHMPRMDGLSAIDRIVANHPARILIVTEDDARGLAFDGLRRGAADVVRRPHPREGWSAAEHDDLRRKIVAIAQTPMAMLARPREPQPRRSPVSPQPAERDTVRSERVSIVGIAGSTGGPVALASLLACLTPSFAAPIVVVQHFAHGFVGSFARWLDRTTPLRAEVARDGELVRPGEVRIAPDDVHVVVDRTGCLRFDRSAAIEGHRPSATRLFESLAPFGGRAAGVVLSGMGRDGSSGLVAMREAGGVVLAQDEATCVVFGMPRAARDAGATNDVLSPERIAARLTSIVRGSTA